MRDRGIFLDNQIKIFPANGQQTRWHNRANRGGPGHGAQQSNFAKEVARTQPVNHPNGLSPHFRGQYFHFTRFNYIKIIAHFTHMEYNLARFIFLHSDAVGQQHTLFQRHLAQDGNVLQHPYDSGGQRFFQNRELISGFRVVRLQFQSRAEGLPGWHVIAQDFLNRA